MHNTYCCMPFANRDNKNCINCDMIFDLLMHNHRTALARREHAIQKMRDRGQRRGIGPRGDDLEFLIHLHTVRIDHHAAEFPCDLPGNFGLAAGGRPTHDNRLQRAFLQIIHRAAPHLEPPEQRAGDWRYGIRPR